jgi:hypothetical protein
MSIDEVKAPAPLAGSLYAGSQAVLATMHHKEAAIAPVFRAALGITLQVPPGIDTDALGTFTGEIARHGSIKDAAVAKARLGMAATGLPFGIASEGAYGPHPGIPFLAAGMEMLVFIDDERGIVIAEHLMDETTNFAHVVTESLAEIGDFLTRVRFPEHGLVVSPNAAPSVPSSTHKGIQGHAELKVAIRQAAKVSADGKALVQTDMRAHQNPTRMAAIGRLAERLAQRILQACPACAMPGFGLTDVVKGLPCEACGSPSALVWQEVFACMGCNHREQAPRADGVLVADPQWCSLCNP